MKSCAPCAHSSPRSALPATTCSMSAWHSRTRPPSVTHCRGDPPRPSLLSSPAAISSPMMRRATATGGCRRPGARSSARSDGRRSCRRTRGAPRGSWRRTAAPRIASPCSRPSPPTKSSPKPRSHTFRARVARELGGFRRPAIGADTPGPRAHGADQGSTTPSARCPTVLRRIPDTTLFFAGPARDATATAYVTSLESLAASLGVQEHVRIVGQIPFAAVPSYFAAVLARADPVVDRWPEHDRRRGGGGRDAVDRQRRGGVGRLCPRTTGPGWSCPPAIHRRSPRRCSRLLGDDAAWQEASAGALRMADAFSLSHTADGILRLYERLLPPS